MLETPVLFLVFNRPDTTAQVFEAIRQAKPKQLFVAADGPRPDKEGEKESCEEVRKIATAIDWDCELKTLFRDENLGCGKGPAHAINWFFEQVEQGIILEDDCLPDLSFFNFCEEQLNKFAFDENIFHISGCNIQFGLRSTRDQYYFSNIPHMWGWATWRRAWNKYDFNSLKNFNRYNIDDYWIGEFESVLKGDVDAWDYQWLYTIQINKSICITPSISLVDNIGFNKNATHTKKPPDWYFFEEKNYIKQLPNPNKVLVNKNADLLTMQLLNGNLSLKNRIRVKLDKFLRLFN